jgi:hypothetical protein
MLLLYNLYSTSAAGRMRHLEIIPESIVVLTCKEIQQFWYLLFRMACNIQVQSDFWPGPPE